MKGFKWQEVLDFLEENLETEFWYTNPRCLNGKKGCLMGEFFKSKGFKGVNGSGTAALGAYIENPRIYPISRIHFGLSFQTGQEILDRYNSLINNEK